MTKKLILLSLNEINFDIVMQYVQEKPGRFPAFEKLLQFESISTVAEDEYENLEPWIQWVSVHTGLVYARHGVFRLGDIVNCDSPQIFETLEEAGFKVGGVSPMNAANRLKQPCFFIPDPWTETPSDSSWWSRNLAKAISQAVNDNAQARITFRNLCVLGLGLIRFVPIRKYSLFVSIAVRSMKSQWLKALFLDLFLHQVHLSLFKRSCPNFSTVFLNAGAHIQHHYFFNSAVLQNATSMRNPEWYIRESNDPILDMLDVYEKIMADYLSLIDAQSVGLELMVATGLSQVPYDCVKFYYRLRDHKQFLELAGIKFKSVIPRMTRDFLIQFDNERDAEKAVMQLQSLRIEGFEVPIFGEIDLRESNSVFVTLTYPDEIKSGAKVWLQGKPIELNDIVSFVAIKNGMHDSKGYLFFSNGLKRFSPIDGAHVSELNDMVLDYFSCS